jgi:hypothetical protein
MDFKQQASLYDVQNEKELLLFMEEILTCAKSDSIIVNEAPWLLNHLESDNFMFLFGNFT